MITARQSRAARALLGWTQETLADIDPAFIHAVPFDLIAISLVDCSRQLGELQILVVLRRNHDNAWAALPSLPVDHAGLYASLLGKFGFCKNNTVPGLGGATHGDGLISQIRVQEHLNAGVKAVEVAVQYYSLHNFSLRALDKR